MTNLTKYTKQQVSEFYVRGKNEFYRISIGEQGEDTDDINYIFADGAIGKAKESHKPFAIHKVKFVYDGKTPEDDIAEVQSTLYFNADGELCGYFSTQDEAKKIEDLRETLAELIPSKDVREHMVKTRHVLTDFEKATLIYNHSEMSFSQKTARLKELMELTKDSNLRKEIQDRLSYDELCFSRFYENNGAYIYELQVYDPEDQGSCEQGYYMSGELAVTCGKKFQENFSVHKIVLLTEEKEAEDCHSDYIATVCFDNQGKVRGYYSSEVEWTAKKSEMDRERFENAFIKIPHPFKNGDFIRVKNNDRLL